MVADAIRFVSAGTGGGGTGLYYVHSDHLGTPQKMTDGNQILVWDAVYKPFGEAQSITGTASNNQRFPGQYADGETGLSYNYFRDYDPSTGRYVESDPIGLVGGMNRYAYVFGNPTSRFDFYGLRPLDECTKEFLKPFFPDLDLDLIDIHSGSALGSLINLVGDFTAITLGSDIYFYGDAYNPNSASGIVLIGHELAHAQQWANANGWDDFLGNYLLEYLQNGYRDNYYEQQARDVAREIEKRLEEAGLPDCDDDEC